MIYGFDIYSGSHGGERGQVGAVPIDYNRVARIQLPDGTRKYQFVCIKATEGTEYQNSWFEQDWADAHAAGFLCDAYHFSRASSNSGHGEADYFVDYVGNHSNGGLVQGDGLDLDSEDVRLNKMGLQNADLLAYHLDFFERIEQPLGFKPKLYSGPWFMDPHKLTLPSGAVVDAKHRELASHGLWIAQYGPLSLPTTVPYPWEFTAMRQYDDNAIIEGCPFPVLADVFYGTREQLARYGWGYVQDPNAGKLVAGTSDVPLTDKGAARDVTQAAVKIATNIEQARRLYVQRNTPLDTLLATSQGDAAAIALVSGLIA